MKKTKGLLSVLLAVLVMVTMQTVSAYAAEKTKTSTTSSSSSSSDKNGWYTKNGEKYYFVDNKMVKAKTKSINGKIYLFGKSGKLLKDGIYEVNGEKYSVDSKGVVKCNQWVGTKYNDDESIYYYAGSKGKITTYSLKYDNDDWYLYIDGKEATSDDFSYVALPDYTWQRYFQLNNDYYYLSCWGLDGSIHAYANATPSTCSSEYMYDMGSHKKLGSYTGSFSTDSRGRLKDGKLYNTKNKYIYNLSNYKFTSKRKSSSDFIITHAYIKLNSVGGADTSIGFFDSSPKEIKSFSFTVYYTNAVGEIVSCRIKHKSSFDVYAIAPFGSKTDGDGTGLNWKWQHVIYNDYTENVHISKAEIQYRDGTSATYWGSDMEYMY